jgi:hypothetical protein
MRKNPLIELAIHPNFNDLLLGNNEGAAKAIAEDIVDRLMDLVPGAKAVRSHSLTQNSRLLNLFLDKGLVYDCNDFIPHESGIKIRPWRHFSGLIKTPHFWEDDIEAEKIEPDYKRLTKLSGPLKIFDFHPIHIFLNTDKGERYAAARAYMNDMVKLHDCVNLHGAGSKTALQSLLYPVQEGVSHV